MPPAEADLKKTVNPFSSATKLTKKELGKDADHLILKHSHPKSIICEAVDKDITF